MNEITADQAIELLRKVYELLKDYRADEAYMLVAPLFDEDFPKLGPNAD